MICNDPASHQVPSNDAVRVVYDRDQFERAWQGAAGGWSTSSARPTYPSAPSPDPRWGVAPAGLSAGSPRPATRLRTR